MTRGIESYSDEQFNAALKETIQKLLAKETLGPTTNPAAILLGGQSGAGKSLLHRAFGNQLQHNVIVVNGDEYRKSHPHFAEIQDRYGINAPAHTAKWAGAMTEALVDAFSAQDYNLIIEGTLRTSEAPIRTAILLRGRGYDVSLAVMAVKPEISLVSCQIRYEMMRLAGTTPRATDPKHHSKIIHEIADNLTNLETSELFSQVYLYNRAAECLYPTAAKDETAAGVLRSVLFGDWTKDERTHYENLRNQLEDLRRLEGRTRHFLS